jgi:hypothetical protein
MAITRSSTPQQVTKGDRQKGYKAPQFGRKKAKSAYPPPKPGK